MRVALYKGTRPGLSGLFNILTRWWLGGPYSHCELVFSDGWSASSSFLDGGVRFKRIEYDPARWDFIELESQFDEEEARTWFVVHQGMKYDLLGLVGFMIRPIKGHSNRVVCSEAVMEALGFSQGYRFDPCNMAVTLRRLEPYAYT